MRTPSVDVIASFPAQPGYEVISLTEEYEVSGIEPCIGFVVMDHGSNCMTIKPVTLDSCFANTEWERFAIKQPDGRVQYSYNGELEVYESLDAFRRHLEARRAKLETDTGASATAEAEAE